MARMMRGRTAEQVDGEWVQCGPIRVYLRPILPTKNEEIDLSVPTGIVKVNVRAGTEERDKTAEIKRDNALVLEKAVFCLLDTDGFELQAIHDEWITFLSQIAKRTVLQGEDVRIDGNWSPEVKRRILSRIEDEGETCPYELEVDEKDPVSGKVSKVTKELMLSFNVWCVWTAQKLGRKQAAPAAALKS